MEHHLFPNGFIDRKECKEIQTKIKVEESGPGQGGRTLNCLTGFSEGTKQQFIMVFPNMCLVLSSYLCLTTCILSPLPFLGREEGKVPPISCHTGNLCVTWKWKGTDRWMWVRVTPEETWSCRGPGHHLAFSLILWDGSASDCLVLGWCMEPRSWLLF